MAIKDPTVRHIVEGIVQMVPLFIIVWVATGIFGIPKLFMGARAIMLPISLIMIFVARFLLATAKEPRPDSWREHLLYMVTINSRSERPWLSFLGKIVNAVGLLLMCVSL